MGHEIVILEISLVYFEISNTRRKKSYMYMYVYQLGMMLYSVSVAQGR